VDGKPVVLKDQRPLIEANVALSPRWEFGDFVQYLNEHVYFWPGDALSPVVSGRRLLAHYADELPLVLRIPARSLVDANPDIKPLFSPFNSGAPRMQRGKPVERGPDLFRPSDCCRRQAHEVIEVAFRGSVVLSDDVTVAGAPEEWVPLAVAT
jgi:hypothetical protein